MDPEADKDLAHYTREGQHACTRTPAPRRYLPRQSARCVDRRSTSGRGSRAAADRTLPHPPPTSRAGALHTPREFDARPRAPPLLRRIRRTPNGRLADSRWRSPWPSRSTATAGARAPVDHPRNPEESHAKKRAHPTAEAATGATVESRVRLSSCLSFLHSARTPKRATRVCSGMTAGPHERARREPLPIPVPSNDPQAMRAAEICAPMALCAGPTDETIKATARALAGPE